MKIIKFTISTVLIFICFTSFSQIKVLKLIDDLASDGIMLEFEKK